MFIGISADEHTRCVVSLNKSIINYYPLVNTNTTTSHILQYFKTSNFSTPPKSACFACPFHSDDYFLWQKHNFPNDYTKTVKLDKLIRNFPNINSELFISKSKKPITEIEEPKQYRLNLNF
jgi:hypothetical protein